MCQRFMELLQTLLPFHHVAPFTHCQAMKYVKDLYWHYICYRAKMCLSLYDSFHCISRKFNGFRQVL